MHHRLAIAFVCASSAIATAQPAGNLNLDEFHPAMDAHGYLTLNGSETIGDKEVSFGLGSLDWGHHLLSFSSGAQSYSVDNMVAATLVGAFGIHLGPVPLEIGTSLPLTIENGAGVHSQGVGDLGLHLKTRFARVAGFGFGAIASVYLPTATKDSLFFGETGVTPQFIGVIDRKFGERLRVSANAGIRLRPTSTFTNPMMTMATVTTSTELPLGVAAAYAFVPRKLELVGEVYGSVPVGPHQNYQQLEALAGVKVYLAKNSYMTIGGGRGLATSQAGNPDFRAFIGIVFEPSPGDRRSQHVADDEVVHETTPPPPVDKDDDDIIDPNKLCNVQIQIDCPPRNGIAVEDGVMITLEPIEFEFDSAVIKPSSYHVVDAVVKALEDNPDVDVSVDGHTDERGSAQYNLDLSQRRAASVMQYLIEHGIKRERLESHGYGKAKPKDSRHNEEAWAKNRRVEFPIKKRQ